MMARILTLLLFASLATLVYFPSVEALALRSTAREQSKLLIPLKWKNQSEWKPMPAANLGSKPDSFKKNTVALTLNDSTGDCAGPLPDATVGGVYGCHDFDLKTKFEEFITETVPGYLFDGDSNALYDKFADWLVEMVEEKLPEKVV